MCIYRVSSLSASFSYRSTCLTTSQIYKLNEQYNSIYGIRYSRNSMINALISLLWQMVKLASKENFFLWYKFHLKNL